MQSYAKERWGRVLTGQTSVNEFCAQMSLALQCPDGSPERKQFTELLGMVFMEIGLIRKNYHSIPQHKLALHASIIGRLVKDNLLLRVNCTNDHPLTTTLNMIHAALTMEAVVMLQFGVSALEEFLVRVYAFPRFVGVIESTPGKLAEFYPEYLDYIKHCSSELGKLRKQLGQVQDILSVECLHSSPHAEAMLKHLENACEPHFPGLVLNPELTFNLPTRLPLKRQLISREELDALRAQASPHFPQSPPQNLPVSNPPIGQQRAGAHNLSKVSEVSA
eukprot:GHVN01039058.1.p1 GENE.GHVN01039058.1~~GHVN01039058.1.p1  ORF type:complete len:277 (-),score=42.78 GHVN01039058.1:26-856(-)